MPDRLDTRLGTLHFFDGFPDKPSTEKLYDNLDFQRAVQVYLLAIPAVSQAANRNAIRTYFPRRPVDFVHAGRSGRQRAAAGGEFPVMGSATCRLQERNAHS